MRHPPNQLALLISLIGAGVAPGAAHARIDERLVDVVESALDVALRAAGESAVVRRQDEWSLGHAWQAAPQGVRFVVEPAPAADLGPVDAAGDAAADSTRDATEPAALEAQTDEAQADGAQADEARDDHVTDGAGHRIAPVVAAPELPATQRAHAPTLKRPAQLRVRGTPAQVTLQIGESVPDAVTVAVSIEPAVQTDRVLQSLAAVLLVEADLAAATDGAGSPMALPSSPASPASVAPVASIVSVAPPTPHVPVVQSAPLASPAAARSSLGRLPEIVVGSQTDKVLDSLSALLSGFDALASPATPRDAPWVVDSHEAKVLATLAAIVEPHHHAEAAAARRAHKRALRDALDAERALDQARQAAPVVAAVAAAVGSAPATAGPGLDIDLSQPMPVEPIAAVPAVALAGATPPESPFDPAPQRRYATEPARPFGDRTVAVSEQSLDGIRGGFVGDNLAISFGIERAVYINGALVTTTSLNLSDLGRLTGGRGSAAFEAGSLGLIQSGAGNTVTMGSIASTSLGTVVQNTLDGQKIQNVTVINATVNSLGILKGLNLQSSMRGAVIDSLRR